MYDKDLALEIMSQIHQAAQTILQRFEPVKKVRELVQTIKMMMDDLKQTDLH